MFWPLPWGRVLSRVEFLGEMSDVLHSCAPLALIPPTPFSHEERRGSLGVLKPETYEGQEYKPVFALAVGLMEIEHYSGSHRG